jgi:hypothetical protein
MIKKKFTDLFITIASSIPRVSFALLLALIPLKPVFAVAQNVEIVNKPQVENDQVTIRLKVTEAQDRPMMNLTYRDFVLMVDGKELEFSPKDWLNPTETEPTPAWIVVLVDFSGSMNQEDSRGQTKLQGAIAAVRQFIQVAQRRGGDTKIAIVPFGEKGKHCPQDYPVNDQTLDKFFIAGDIKLENYLQYLESLKPCASTNLYAPLNNTLRFFRDDPRFIPPQDPNQPEDQQPTPPRLSIIFLSDGFHTAGNIAEYWQELETLIKSDLPRQNQNVIIHTLGYGLTPKQLGEKYNLGRPATAQDVNSKKVPEAEFVDQEVLQKIANLGGGISEFSGNASDIARNLELFLNALLGEYQISYIQQNADRGSKHEVYVKVKTSEQSAIESEMKPYTIGVFGRTLPLEQRITMIISIILILGIFGVIPFWFWGKLLKE